MSVRLTAKTLFSIVLATCVYFLLPESCPEAARRTAAIFTIAALFWALEIIPLYATSILTVLFLILFLGRPGGVLGFDKGGFKTFFFLFSSPVIILFFGGFTLAKALGKYGVDRILARNLLKLFGHHPYSILLGFMITTAFLSMWISNTATAAMMIAMIHPILHNLEQDDPFRKSIVIAIAFAANIGGIGTPVGTPPNAIALGILGDHGIFLNFVTWMKMAVPLVILLLFCTSLILYFLFKPKKRCLEFTIQKKYGIQKESKIVIGITVLTIALWLSSGWHQIPEAIIGLLAAGILTALGLLHRNDIKDLDWDILILMWGGLSLGKGMQISGLTNWILSLPLFSYEGFLLISVLAIVAAILAMFISNTATANLIIPLAISLPQQNPVVLAVTAALACSFGMVLPVSTPPNAIAFSTGTFSSKEMFQSGILVCIVSLCIVLLGYQFVLVKSLQMGV